MMGRDDDAELIRRYQEGDEATLELLVKRHQAKAYQYAYRLCRDADMAADIVAESFFRVCRSLRGFKGNCAFSSWLYRIITNCYLDVVKRAHDKDQVSFEATFCDENRRQLQEPVCTGPTSQRQAELSYMRDRLNWAIEQLPPSQKRS